MAPGRILTRAGDAYRVGSPLTADHPGGSDGESAVSWT